jgi:hypothetical protein
MAQLGPAYIPSAAITRTPLLPTLLLELLSLSSQSKKLHVQVITSLPVKRIKKKLIKSKRRTLAVTIAELLEL